MSLGTQATKPLAVQQLVHDANGQSHVKYVDPKTGAEVKSLGGYNVIQNQDQYYTPNDLNPLVEDTNKPSVAKQALPPPPKVEGQRGERTPAGGVVDPRSVSNNFGYMHNPAALGLAGMIPGPLGMLAKGANIGINYNNTVASDSARKMMGVPELSRWDTFKESLRGTKGAVGNVDIGPNTYGVGFEATMPDGRTAMTPNEARLHASLTHNDINLATPDEVKAKKSQFDTGFQHHEGLLSGLRDHFTSFLDGIFGQDQQNFSPNVANFPDRPTAQPGENMTNGSFRGSDGRNYSGNGLY